MTVVEADGDVDDDDNDDNSRSLLVTSAISTDLSVRQSGKEGTFPLLHMESTKNKNHIDFSTCVLVSAMI